MVARVSRASARVARKRQLQAANNTEQESGSDSDSGSGAGSSNENENLQEESSASENESFEENEAEDELQPRKRRRRFVSVAETQTSLENEAISEGSEESHLFRALSSREVAVADLALEWIDSFEEDESANTSAAITDLFNLVSRACGCTHMAQPHDLLNEDSAEATVGEIAAIFQTQASHEYPFVAMHKNTRHFRQNMTEFFKSIVLTAHEKGVLYKAVATTEEGSSYGTPLMNAVVAWLVALSACNVRPLRYVSTSLLLTIQTQFCELASTTTVALQKQQRQLNSARNNRRIQAARVAVISESIDSFTLHKNTVLEYIGDIFQHVFVNRYRDIDTRIRGECLRALAQWMVSYEEMFLRADYLRYIGWLLSDPADNVRLEAVKSLFKLYKFIHGKREAMSIGFRQFTERFKDQFISMVWKEKGSSIRVVLLEILTELNGLGFLEPSDVRELCSFGFYLANHESTASADTKSKIEVAKFLAAVVAEQARMEIEPFSSFLETHESTHFDADENALSVLQCLKYKKLAELFESSYAHYLTIKQGVETIKKPMFVLVDSLFRVIYSLPTFSGQWEGLIKYTLDDYSAISFINKEDPSAAVEEDIVQDLVQRIEVSTSTQKQVFLGFIAAAIIHILTKEPPKRANALNVHDDINAVLPVFIRFILPLEMYSRTGLNLYSIFMSIWNSILITVPSSITQLYTTVSDITDYNTVHDKVLHYYFDMVSPDTMLQEAFDTYFSLVLKNFEGSGLGDVTSKNDRLLNANIKMQIEDLLHSLATEGVDTLFSTEPFEHVIDIEENGVLSDNHKINVNKLLRVAPILQKFAQIARVINISRYVAEPTFGTSNVLLEALQSQLVSNFDFITLTRLWPSNYTAIMSQISESWLSVLDFVLVSLSWKLEDLTYASGDNSAQSIDISLFLDDFNGLLVSTGDHCVAIGTSAKEVNEITTDSNTKSRSLVQNLVSLEHKFATYYIDMLASLRTFYDKFKDGDNFKNFESFFENQDGVGPLSKNQLPERYQESLMHVFFIHESRLAQLKDVSLDRQNNEDVNFEDFVFDGDCLGDEGSIQHGESVAEKDHLLWAAERILCVYTLKLYSLIHTDGFSRDAMARIELNTKRLGGSFEKIVGVGQAQTEYAETNDNVEADVDNE